MSGSSNGSADWIQKNGSGGDSAQQSEAREHDYNLPIANVSRIMKKVLPGNAKVSKEAKDMVQECVSEFIGFITNEASHRCMSDKRKTVNGDDLLTSLSALGFDDYVNPLKLYLAKYRELESGMKGSSSSRDGDGSKRDTTASTPEQNPEFALQQPDTLDDQVNGKDIYFPFIQDH